MVYLVVVKHHDDPFTGKFKTVIDEYVTRTDAENRVKAEQRKLERSMTSFNHILGIQSQWPDVSFVGFSFAVMKARRKGGM